MSIKWVCDQDGTEVVMTKINPHTHSPDLPTGWNQEVILENDGTLSVRHFASPEASLAWHQANDPE